MAKYREFIRPRVDLDRKEDPKTWQERNVRDIVEGSNVPGYGLIVKITERDGKIFWENAIGLITEVAPEDILNSYQ